MKTDTRTGSGATAANHELMPPQDIAAARRAAAMRVLDAARLDDTRRAAMMRRLSLGEYFPQGFDFCGQKFGRKFQTDLLKWSLGVDNAKLEMLRERQAAAAMIEPRESVPVFTPGRND
jgi:hypothetical protein